MLSDFLSLIFPAVCAACGDSLNKGEEEICTNCLFTLPQTNYHLEQDNPVARLFWGRVDVKQATAYYLFSKEGKVQELIHQLKYKGKKEVGVAVGKQFAYELKNASWISSLDLIVPVPLHAKKLKARGYNQAEFFAAGLGEILQLPLDTSSLIRSSLTDTQTRRSRYLRWKNVESVFSIKQPELLAHKHILLVDDVVTTGSTLEACAQKILAVPGTSVSVATMAYAAL